MPNVGKPSKGCQNCRERKVKCDQKRPSCSQCLRIQKECHGYRDPLSMMFRNQSDDVAQKAELRYQQLSKGRTKRSSRQRGIKNVDSEGCSASSSASSSSSEDSSPPSTNGSDLQIITDPTGFLRRQRLPFELMPSIEKQAECFFISKYVAQQTIARRGQYDYLFDLLWEKPGASKTLQISVNAVSLAALANSTKSIAISRMAQEQYVLALGMTNEALRSTDAAKEDGTLVAVLMLGLYENFTYRGKQSLKAWQEHTNGACALFKLRGTPRTSVGIRVFQQFYGTVLLVALESQTPIPPAVREIWEALTQFGDYSTTGKDFTIKFVRFLHRAIDKSVEKAKDPGSRLMEVLALARELRELLQLIPEIWRYETVSLEQPVEHLYGTSYYIYMDPWIAQMWNNLRSVGLHLHSSIRQQLNKGAHHFSSVLSPEDVDAHLKAAEQAIREDASGICASVPQLIGQIRFPCPPTYKVDPHDEAFRLHPPGTFLTSGHSTGMNHLVWPLYSMGMSDICPQSLRQWCIKKLQYLALTMGTQQAVLFAEQLKEKSRPYSVIKPIAPQPPSESDHMCTSSGDHVGKSNYLSLRTLPGQYTQGNAVVSSS